MCGIAGFYSTTKLNDPAQLRTIAGTMARAIEKRGPDGEGIWTDPDTPLALAHRRLSIIDLSDAGAQPMASASGRYVVTFNGEIYNFRDLQAELSALGVKFKGRSDTEIMLAAFEQWGVNRALHKLGGMFAFALWDRQTRQLHLVRDRMGKKPLYIGWAGSCFVFASTLAPFRAHPDFKPVLNRDAAALYLRYGYVPAPHSIYQNVWQILPGNRITLSPDGMRPGSVLPPQFESYWHPPRIVDDARQHALNLDDDALIYQFEILAKACVADRMVSDVPLGAFLSGGIDSSAVVALMQAQSPTPVKTYTIGFTEGGYDESAHAAAVAAHLGTDHHEMILNPAEAQGIIPSLPDIYDEPFADSSQIPSILVSKFARQSVTVALSGDGGDELLGGYMRHVAVPAMWARVGWMPAPVRAAMARGIRGVSVARWNRMVPGHPQFGERIHKLAAILPKKNLEDIYIHVMSLWNDPEGVIINGHEPSIVLRQLGWQPRGLNFAERMMYGDALSYLPNDILVKMDRASMACGLEARAPLLDARMFEFCWRLPSRARIRDGRGKWLLRKMLARHMPESMIDRPKQGFAVPVGAWLRDPLRDWAEDLLDETKMRQQGVIDPAPVQKIWREHLGGRGNHTGRIWAVLMLQAWHRRWIENS